MSNAGFFISLFNCFGEHQRMFCRRCLQHAQADMIFKSVMCVSKHIGQQPIPSIPFLWGIINKMKDA